MQLLDERGGLLFTAPAPAVSSEHGIEGSTEVVQALVPWRDDAAAIVLCRGREILARSRIAPAPQLDLNFPALADLEAGKGVVSFQTDAAHATAVAVRVSVDAGATWVATIRRDGKGEVDVAPLLTRAGDECFLQVIASSGYYSNERTSERFRLRPRNQDILAWSSAEDGHVSQSRPVELFAIANGGATSIDNLSWYPICRVTSVRALGSLLPCGQGGTIEVRSREPFHQPAQFDLDVD